MPFKNLIKVFTKVNFQKLIKLTFENGYVKNAYLDVLQERLYRMGTDANKKRLKTDISIIENWHSFDYAYKTAITGGYSKGKRYKSKKEKNQPYNRVTLQDTGDFYNSFVLRVNEKYILISANYQKENGNIYENFTHMYSSFQQFDEAITGLQQQEWTVFLDKVFVPYFLQILKNTISSVQV